MRSHALSPSGESPASVRATAIVVAGEEETRVLLRGLLRLHHYQVLGESDGVTGGLALVEREHPAVAIVDTTLTEGSATDLVGEVKRRFSPTRVILLSHGTRPVDPQPGAAPDVVLRRPFRIQEFAQAISGAAGPPTTG